MAKKLGYRINGVPIYVDDDVPTSSGTTNSVYRDHGNYISGREYRDSLRPLQKAWNVGAVEGGLHEFYQYPTRLSKNGTPNHFGTSSLPDYIIFKVNSNSTYVYERYSFGLVKTEDRLNLRLQCWRTPINGSSLGTSEVVTSFSQQHLFEPNSVARFGIRMNLWFCGGGGGGGSNQGGGGGGGAGALLGVQLLPGKIVNVVLGRGGSGGSADKSESGAGGYPSWGYFSDKLSEHYTYDSSNVFIRLGGGYGGAYNVSGKGVPGEGGRAALPQGTKGDNFLIFNYSDGGWGGYGGDNAVEGKEDIHGESVSLSLTIARGMDYIALDDKFDLPADSEGGFGGAYAQRHGGGGGASFFPVRQTGGDGDYNGSGASNGKSGGGGGGGSFEGVWTERAGAAGGSGALWVIM